MDLEQARRDSGVAGCGFFNSLTSMMIPKGLFCGFRRPVVAAEPPNSICFGRVSTRTPVQLRLLGVSVERTEELPFSVDVANLRFVAYQTKLQLIGFLCGFLSLCREWN